MSQRTLPPRKRKIEERAWSGRARKARRCVALLGEGCGEFSAEQGGERGGWRCSFMVSMDGSGVGSGGRASEVGTLGIV